MALTAQQKLDDAEAAYHKLVTGKSVRVLVDRNGERVEYTMANKGALQAYIAELKKEISGEDTSGPLGVMF